MRVVPKIIMMLLLLPVVASCKKDEQPQPQSEEVTTFDDITVAMSVGVTLNVKNVLSAANSIVVTYDYQ